MSWHKWWQPTPGASRRAFLGGAAVALALPALEALRPARAGAPLAPRRAVFWYLPCGIVMDAWRPGAEGPLREGLPAALAALEDVRDEVLVVSGLANRPADAANPGDHARGTGSFLTCAPVHRSATEVHNGTSIDQVIAAEIGADTALPSLELGTTPGSSVGDCDSGYSCVYGRSISWRDADTPNPTLTDPALVFDRLFGGFDPALAASEARRRRQWRTSVLDHVRHDAASLQPHLSARDRSRLDEFLTGVRELELRVEATAPVCPGVSHPGQGLDYPQTVRAMTDLTVLALQCDLSRVVTFMMENSGSYRSFDFLGVIGAHHELSHHQGAAWKLEALTTINAWEMAEFAHLVRRLGETEDVDGASLLHNTVAFVSSEISDGDLHNHDDLPVLLAGQGGGAVRTGRHLALQPEAPLADLYLGIAEAVGVRRTSFGQDGRQPISLT